MKKLFKFPNISIIQRLLKKFKEQEKKLIGYKENFKSKGIDHD